MIKWLNCLVNTPVQDDGLLADHELSLPFLKSSSREPFSKDISNLIITAMYRTSLQCIERPIPSELPFLEHSDN
jgi:hypothetical protein